jgi:hypothetical protein
LTCTEPPHQATHWTGRAMAKAIGISVGSVQRIWRAHKLQPQAAAHLQALARLELCPKAACGTLLVVRELLRICSPDIEITGQIKGFPDQAN